MDITLASIKPDTTDPGLEEAADFDITGDEVTPGTVLKCIRGTEECQLRSDRTQQCHP